MQSSRNVAQDGVKQTGSDVQVNKPTTRSDRQNNRSTIQADGDKIIAMWWRDHCDVLASSSMHNTSASTVLKRPKGGHEKQPLSCPIIDYNQFMGRVDLTDQNLSYYSRRTLKWWKKIFCRLVDISIINSWIIFRYNNPDSNIKSHREFRLEFIEELVQDLKASPDCPDYISGNRGRHPAGDGDKRLIGKHFGYKGTKRGKCAVCSWKISENSGKKGQKNPELL